MLPTVLPPVIGLTLLQDIIKVYLDNLYY
jgi:hypothetical protein